MEPQERIKTAATGMMSALKTQTLAEAGEQPTHAVVDAQTIDAIIADWPAMSMRAAKEILKKYGRPNEATPSRLIWYNNGPWKRTIAYRDEIPHNFPQPHSDTVEQFIDYHVPPDKFSDLAKFDGSVIVERTKGEVSARCDMEAANFLALNLMHEIVTGKQTVKEARRRYSEITSAYVMNRPAPYAERFQFKLPQEETADTDETMIASAIMRQAKAKDMVTGRGAVLPVVLTIGVVLLLGKLLSSDTTKPAP
jgi:hypothetical protein